MMEQLPLLTVLVILCTMMSATLSHRLLHIGELINRENVKIRLGQLNRLVYAKELWFQLCHTHNWL